MLRLCAILLTFVAVSFTAEAARSDAKLFRVTLLGTGSPDPVVNRFSASTLVEAGEQKLLFDAGRGVTIRLWQCQVPLSRIDVVFFTHYHSDHTIGLPDLLLTGWLPSSFGHRVAPLHVVGPVGAKNLLSNLSAAYSADIKGRQEEQHLPPEGVASKVDEFTNDGVVYEKDGVRVTAFEVDHGFKPGIDYDGRSVLLSGDTKLNENVVKIGEGVDLLLHEVFVASEEFLKNPAIQHILSIHTTPSQAGTVFARTRPKLAAYTHIVTLGSPTAPPPTIDDIVAETRQNYKGPLVVGEDLMRFEIGEGGVSAFRVAP